MLLLKYWFCNTVVVLTTVFDFYRKLVLLEKLDFDRSYFSCSHRNSIGFIIFCSQMCYSLSKGNLEVKLGEKRQPRSVAGFSCVAMTYFK